jgi:hypothetical protein
MLRDVLDFLKAVVKSLAAYLTGGVVVALWLVYERVEGKTISLRAFIAGVIVFLFVSFFAVWRAQRKAVRAANQETENLKDQVADLNQKLDDANSALIYNREQVKPNFIGSVGQIATGHHVQLDCPIMFVAFEIRNTGARAVLARGH